MYKPYGLSIHTKLSAWGANNGDNWEGIVEDDTECKDQFGMDNGNEDNDSDMATQGLSIKDCDYCSSSEIMNRTAKVSYAKWLSQG